MTYLKRSGLLVFEVIGFLGQAVQGLLTQAAPDPTCFTSRGLGLGHATGLFDLMKSLLKSPLIPRRVPRGQAQASFH